MFRKKKEPYDPYSINYHDPEYTSLVSKKCKCGHTLNIYNRHRREICNWCGRIVFLRKKDEFIYNMKRKGVI